MNIFIRYTEDPKAGKNKVLSRTYTSDIVICENSAIKIENETGSFDVFTCDQIVLMQIMNE